MEAGWSTRRVARSLGRSDCVVRRCWDQWIQEMSFIRRPGLGSPRQTSHGEDSHIIRKARVQPTDSSAVIQTQVAPSLGASMSSRTIRRCLTEGHLGSITCAALDAHSSTLPFGVVPRPRKLDCSGMKQGRLYRQIHIQSQQ
ncbi:HTH_Tnp_Tc3_2 domain-containing protein [Trichonephila clavipes]|uniref:HTH_Tnp_Tc3_2 domain-containing protein n=1 Tax=Trichonephila clavipes TaxID=2585209 RepID=A0A8X6SBH6_TRICX|nr:HTH_Tnp_Tc3_2 domain-containing protein [Trichonephila clavipes]